MGSWLKKSLALTAMSMVFTMPAFSLDLDSTVTDKNRTNYSKSTVQQQTQTQTQQVKQTPQTQTTAQPQQAPKSEAVVETQTKPVINPNLPTVPKLPSNATSKTVAPINTKYSGKVPNADALIPCTDIKVSGLNTGNKVAKTQTTKQTKTGKTTKQTQYYKTATLPKGTQIRVVNQSKITDYLSEGQGIVFVTLQEIKTPYFTMPKNTKITAKVVDSHRPQMTCNGGLVGLRFVSANINGYNQTINGGIIRLKTDKIRFSNLKGEHTYKKNVSKKAKWGQNKFKQYSKTSRKLANKGAGIIIAPFPYIGGCILAGASTVSSPATALLGKGGNLNIPANTTFTMKLYEDASIRLK